MRVKVLALVCAVALGLCGCAVNGVPVDQPAEASVEPIPNYLLEACPVEVEMDGITFRVPDGDGWLEPNYSMEGMVSVFFYPEGQMAVGGNSGFAILGKNEGDDELDAPDLGTGLSDAEYINAGIEHFDKLEDLSDTTVYKVSDWEVRHDPGGVVCSCYVGSYEDPQLTHAKSDLTTGYLTFIYTDHGSYIFNTSYTISDFGNDDTDDTLQVLQVADTLRVN